VIKNEGALSLYAGLPAGCYRQLVYAGARFGLYEEFRDRLEKVRAKLERSDSDRYVIVLAIIMPIRNLRATPHSLLAHARSSSPPPHTHRLEERQTLHPVS